jgi:hypothetical protein
VLEPLRSLRLEIDSIRLALRQSGSKFITDQRTRERTEQLFLGWCTNLRPGLLAYGVPEEPLRHADKEFTKLVGLTTRRSLRRKYLLSLGRIRTITTGQILLEVARIAPGAEVGKGHPSPRGKLIPEIPDLPNEFVPNALYGWVHVMQKFLKRNIFEYNVFIMVAYKDSLSDLIRGVKDTVTQIGLNAIVAKDHRLTDDLYNPLACLLCCRYGIAIFDRPEARQAHNANVTYELAVMQLLKRPCAILKHRSLDTMPSDFLHRLFEDYDSSADALDRVREWWSRVNPNGTKDT